MIENYPLFSIIVPVYNVEKYLPKCLNSIINQTYNNYEVILVDDGSIDTSPTLCDNYVLLDNRFKVIHKVNEGVSSARNIGLSAASGEWILFVDADDYLPQDALCLYNSIINNNDVDMVLGGYVECDEQDTIILKNTSQFDKLIDMIDCLKLFYKSDTVLFQGYIWNRLMKRSIISDHNLKFNESIYFKEDGLFAVQYMNCCSKRCFYTSNVVYYYLQHDQSSMHQYNTIFSYKYLSNLDARILCFKCINNKYKDKELTHLAKYAIISFYFQAKSRINKTKGEKKQLKKELFLKVLHTVGICKILRFKLATLKGYIYSKIQ